MCIHMSAVPVSSNMDLWASSWLVQVLGHFFFKRKYCFGTVLPFLFSKRICLVCSIRLQSSTLPKPFFNLLMSPLAGFLFRRGFALTGVGFKRSRQQKWYVYIQKMDESTMTHKHFIIPLGLWRTFQLIGICFVLYLWHCTCPHLDLMATSNAPSYVGEDVPVLTGCTWVNQDTQSTYPPARYRMCHVHNTIRIAITIQLIAIWTCGEVGGIQRAQMCFLGMIWPNAPTLSATT